MKSTSSKSPKFQLLEFPNYTSWTLCLPDGEITLRAGAGKLTYERALYLLTRGQYVMHRDAEDLIE